MERFNVICNNLLIHRKKKLVIENDDHNSNEMWPVGRINNSDIGDKYRSNDSQINTLYLMMSTFRPNDMIFIFISREFSVMLYLGSETSFIVTLRNANNKSERVEQITKTTTTTATEKQQNHLSGFY